TAEEVLAGLRPRGRPERAREVLGRRIHERKDLLALLAVGACVAPALRDGDAEAPGQRLDRLREREAVVEHHELEDVAVGAAAEAVEAAELGPDVERRRLFLVEGAEALPRRAELLERDVVGHDVDDVGGTPDLVDEGIREGHQSLSSTIVTPPPPSPA